MSGMRPPRVLVIEDGEEYSRLLDRFLVQHFVFVRAGDDFMGSWVGSMLQ